MGAEKINIENYQMFSVKGNKACHGLVKRASRKIGGKRRLDQSEFVAWLQGEVEKISDKHGEIYDTEPRGTIEHILSKVAEEHGYAWDLNWSI